MIIKLEKIISCTSEDPSYPASNLLQQRSNTSWRCAKPGELLASVIFQLGQPSCITGMDIGNYRSCIVVVTASTSAEPDDWIPIINHQFLTHDEAANGKFRDQVQLFTKKELNADNLRTKFDRVKVTCMQSANLREPFGLAFIVLRTEVVVDLGVDVFARFKLKKDEESGVEDLKEKYSKLVPGKRASYKEELKGKIREASASKFARRQSEGAESADGRKLPESADRGREESGGESEASEGKKNDLKPSLKKKMGEGAASARKTGRQKLPDNDGGGTEEKSGKAEVAERKEDVNSVAKLAKTKVSTPVARTPFGDVITPDTSKKGMMKKRSLYYSDSEEEGEEGRGKDKSQCALCAKESGDGMCKVCNRLRAQNGKAPEPPEKKPKIAPKPTKTFEKLFEDVTFALSGYQNPQRDDIRRKALKMGGKYIADPNTTDKKCTHLVCAFKNTPKSQQLRGHTKIVSGKFIVECFDKKTRFPWRRFALDKKEKDESESEEEIAAAAPAPPPDPYEQDTDSDSNY